MTAAGRPDPSSAESAPLLYHVPKSGVSRRGFRLLLLLTATNTVLLGWFVLGPQIYGFVRTQWSAHKQLRAQRQNAATDVAARLASLPAQAAAMRHVFPDDTIVYRDGGTERQRREAQAAAATQPAGVAWPGVLPPPAPFSQLPKTIPGWGLLIDATRQVLFLHELTAPGGAEPMLIVVLVRNGGPQRSVEGRSFQTLREFVALTLLPATKSRPLECVAWTHWTWDPTEALEGDPSKGAAIKLADMRLTAWAGQANAMDASRFTIRYDVDGVPGEIFGQVGYDHKVRLTPTGPVTSAWKQKGTNK